MGGNAASVSSSLSMSQSLRASLAAPQAFAVHVVAEAAAAAMRSADKTAPLEFLVRLIELAPETAVVSNLVAIQAVALISLCSQNKTVRSLAAQLFPAGEPVPNLFDPTPFARLLKEGTGFLSNAASEEASARFHKLKDETKYPYAVLAAYTSDAAEAKKARAYPMNQFYFYSRRSHHIYLFYFYFFIFIFPLF